MASESDAIQKLVGFGIGLLTLVVILYLGPGIGEQVSTALPVNQTGDFAGATTGAAVWTNGTSVMGIVVIVALLAIVIKSLLGMRGGKN